MLQCKYCGKSIDEEHIMCEECEQKATKLLENNKELIAANNKYIKIGILKYATFVLSAIEFFIIYFLLENGSTGFLGGMIVILFIPTIICFIISTIIRSTHKRKITKILDSKMS